MSTSFKLVCAKLYNGLDHKTLKLVTLITEFKHILIRKPAKLTLLDVPFSRVHVVIFIISSSILVTGKVFHAPTQTNNIHGTFY